MRPCLLAFKALRFDRLQAIAKTALSSYALVAYRRGIVGQRRVKKILGLVERVAARKLANRKLRSFEVQANETDTIQPIGYTLYWIVFVLNEI